MLKMQLIADKPIDDKRNYRIKEKGFGEENNVALWFQKRILMTWHVGLILPADEAAILKIMFFGLGPEASEGHYFKIKRRDG